MKFTIANLLSLITIVALSIALITLALNQERIITLEAADTNYSWKLRESLIAQSPLWDDGKANPPLPLGKAISISDNIIENLNIASKPLGVGEWNLEALTLSPLDGRFADKGQRWCYIAKFFGSRQPLHMGEPEMFSAVILMDGTIIVGEGNWRTELDDAMNKIYSAE